MTKQQNLKLKERPERLNRGNVCKCYLTRKDRDRLDVYFGVSRYIWNSLLSLDLKQKGLYHYKDDESPITEEELINHKGQEFKGDNRFTTRNFATLLFQQVKKKIERGEEISKVESDFVYEVGCLCSESATVDFVKAVLNFSGVLKTYREHHPIEEGPPAKRLRKCPKFKSARDLEQSFSFDLGKKDWKKNIKIKGKDGWVTIPVAQKSKNKNIKLFIKGVRDFNDPTAYVSSVTISRDSTGKYWCSLAWNFKAPESLPPTGKAVGVDINELWEKLLYGEIVGIDTENEELKQGIRDAFALSDLGGEHPLTDEDINKIKDYLVQNLKDEQTVKELQQALSKKEGPRRPDKKNGLPGFPGSNRYQHLRIKKAILQDKIAKRNKLMRGVYIKNIVDNHDLSCIENLSVQGKGGMLWGKGVYKKRKHNRRIYKMSSYAFKQELNDKAVEKGRYVQELKQTEPTSQRCSRCGKLNPLMKDTRNRVYKCIDDENGKGCGFVYPRDTNAANNIRKEGEKQYKKLLQKARKK